MRRSEYETIEVTHWGDRLAWRIANGEIDAEFVIRILEQYATDRRVGKLQTVFAARLDAVTVVLDGLHDPHNGAALVRTSEALGLARIHVIAQQAGYLAHAKVAKGTHKWLEVRAHENAEACVQSLHASGHVLVGAHPQGVLLPADLAKLPRVALVLGNEHEGISKPLLDACEANVRVPMRGFAESLNVSVSGAILLAFATESRPGDLPADEQRRLYARGLAVTVPHAAALLERAAGS